MNGGYQDDWTGCNLPKWISRINVELCSIPNTRKNLFSFTIQPYIWIISEHTSSLCPFHPLLVGIQRSNVSSFYHYSVKNKKLFSSLRVYCFCEKLQIFHLDRSEGCREYIENSWKERISSTAQTLSAWKIKREAKAVWTLAAHRQLCHIYHVHFRFPDKLTRLSRYIRPRTRKTKGQRGHTRRRATSSQREETSVCLEVRLQCPESRIINSE